MKFLYVALLSFLSIFYSINKYADILSIVISSLLIIVVILSIIHNNKIIINKKNIIYSIICSIILSILIIPTFIYKTNIKYIAIENISDEPIIIEGIYKDERLVKTNHKYDKNYDLINNASLKTEYKEYNKIDQQYKLTLNPQKFYIIYTNKVKNIEIDFQKKEVPYNILINNKKISVDKFLYSKNKKANKIYDSSYKYKFNNMILNSNVITNILLSTVVLFLSFFNCLYSISSRKSIIKLLFITIIELNSIINISIFTKVILIIFLFLFIRLDLKITKSSNKNKVLYLIGSILISFSFVGDRLINDNISFILIIIYLIFVLFIYLLFPYFISFIDYIKVGKSVSNKNIIKHRIIVFVITFGICFLYHYIFYPFIVHADTYMELNDIERGILSNWHPYFHALLLGIFKITFGNVKFFLYFRFIIYSLLLNNILFYFNKRGLKLKSIYLISILFTLCPVTGIMLSTLVKDIEFSLFLVSLTFYLYLLIKDNNYFVSSKFNYIYLLFSLVFVSVFRHNGVYIYISIVVLLLLLSYRKKVFYLFIVSIVSFIFVFIIKFPLYEYLGVEDAPKNFNIATMMHGINYLIVNDIKIDSSSKKYITNNVLPEKEIITSYDKYNIDLFLHYTNYNIRDKDIDKKRIISIYFKELIKHPIYLIKDRLYGSDLVWNVSEKDRVRVYKYQTVYDEFDSNYAKEADISLKFSSVYKIVNKLLIYISNNELFNALLFRAGIYLDLLIIIGIYFIINKKKYLFCYMLPIIINIITLFIAMGHQEYRYVWMILLVALLLILSIRYDAKSNSLDFDKQF